MGGGLRTTPLWVKHLEAGARPGSFAGWLLPLEYRGVAVEVRAVRRRVGLFDVSHMGQIAVRGPGAASFLQALLTNEVRELAPGRARYALMLNEAGGILEDLLVYRLGQQEFLLVVNAANTAADLAWLRERVKEGVEVADRSAEYALLALQGPRATRLLEELSGISLQAVRPFGLARVRLAGGEALLSRTGYTGEDGWEIFLRPEAAAAAWERFLDRGVEPCGLASRDVLRLEAGLPLYGQELTPEITPLEAGLERFIRLDKDFVGRKALTARAPERPRRRLAGLRLTGRGVPRRGYHVWQGGERVGQVTSGTYSPTLEAGLALAYLPAAGARPGSEAGIEIRGEVKEAQVVELPFYRGGEAGCSRRTGVIPGSTSGS